MRNVLLVTSIVLLVMCGTSCYKPERQTISISGTVDLFHMSNVQGEDFSTGLPFDTCDVQGKIPEDGIYGQLTISLEEAVIGTPLNPEGIDKHVFTGFFGDRTSLFAEGNPNTVIAYQILPGEGYQCGIVDITFDNEGNFINPSVVMFIPGEIENGTFELGMNLGEDVALFVVDWQGIGVFECIHAVGLGEIEIND